MATHLAAKLPSLRAPLSLEQVPTPTPGSGQVLLQVLAVPILSYMRDVLNGTVPYPLAVPFVPGVSAIGRITAVGTDTTDLRPGQLVFVDPTVRARDDASGAKGTSILLGLYAGFTPAARVLAEHDWRDGSWAQRLLAPLENVAPIDEQLLVERRGYSFAKLTWINALLVPYGGLLAGALQAGETLILCFATGHFGGSAVDVALAMGVGRIVAVGRRIEPLRALQEKYGAAKIEPVVLASGQDAAQQTEALQAATPRGAGADLFLDLAPGAAGVEHIRGAVGALKAGGRAVFMGGAQADVGLPYAQLMNRNISIRGNFMYPHEAPAQLIRLIESGNLPLEGLNVENFELRDIEKAIDEAGKKTALGNLVTISP